MWLGAGSILWLSRKIFGDILLDVLNSG